MSQPYMAEQPLPENHSKNIIFNKYETGRVLGKGTFAKVYHGRHLITGESVAIKVIDKEKLKKRGMIDRIEREVSVMRMVRHPNIVELKEVMATKGKVFLVMDYVKGGELFAKVVKGKLKEDVARKYFQQLVSAVDFCHSRGVYHRDLKPENLLLDENGNLKVSDFGLSALAEQFRNDGLLHTPCGTPSYVAPEVLRKKGYDGSKADIWSCGVILYVLLSGLLPFQEENVMNMYRKIFKADYECPSWISTEASDLISKLLVVNARKRYSIQEITRHSWFQAGFTRPVWFQAVQEPASMDITDEKDDKKSDGRNLAGTKSPPPFYNAFNLISSFSPGFDLSSLFESKMKSSSIFTSKCSASTVVAKLEMLAKKMNYKLISKKDFSLEMQGNSEGRKGKLEVSAKVFEVAPEVAAVEFSKSSGDTLEYNKFCGEDVRTALKDIVWSWQGESAVEGSRLGYE